MKQKRYWLRGCMIGVLVSICAYFFLNILPNGAFDDIPSIPVIIVFVTYLPVMFFGDKFFDLDNLIQGTIPFTLFVVYGLIIGSIIGFIYGKIKNRNNLIN